MKASISGRTVTLWARGNVSGQAKVTGYKYDFGDGYATYSSGSATHTYNRYATYHTKAWISYWHHGKTYVTAPCTLIVKVGHPHKPQPTYKPHPTYTPVHTYKPGYDHRDDKNDECQCDNPQYKDDSYVAPIAKDNDDDDYHKPNDDKDSSNSNVNNNTNNNNSSAVANVVVAPANVTAKTAGYVEPQPTVSSSDTVPIYEDGLMLPETGLDDPVLNILGLGSLAAAGTAYAASRRELLQTIFRR